MTRQMALHEAKRATVYRVDPCHKFAWCITACIREQAVDTARAADMLGFAEQHTASPVLGDAAMVLADPLAAAALAAAAHRELLGCVTARRLPAACPLLVGRCPLS